MDTSQAQGVLVNVVGLLYAGLGFSLSVISALFNLLYRRAAGPNELIVALAAHTEQSKSPRSTKSRQSPVRRMTHDEPTKALSRHTVNRIFFHSPLDVEDVAFYESPPSSPSSIPQSLSTTDSEKTEKTVVCASKEKRPFNHQRSQSIPAILVDNYDSAEYITWNSADLEEEARPPLYEDQEVTPPSKGGVENSVLSSHHSICDNIRSRPRILTSKLWGKDKKMKPLKRCRSSPQLYQAPGLPLPLPLPPSDRLTGSESENVPDAKANLKKTKSWKGLRKARSGTLPEKSRADRKAEKKKSQTLRTHPYEAPYFAPPPMPAMPVNITFVGDHSTSGSGSRESSPKSSIDRKPSRRLSLKL